MADEDKTRTLHIPGQPLGPSNDGRQLADAPTQVLTNTVVAKFTVIDGPGAGQIRSVYSGTNQIGRGVESKIQLDFGDTTISRLQHAVLVYDKDDGTFTLLDGGKQNPVLVNGERLADKRRLQFGDIVKIGLTTLRLTKD